MCTSAGSEVSPPSVAPPLRPPSTPDFCSDACTAANTFAAPRPSCAARSPPVPVRPDHVDRADRTTSSTGPRQLPAHASAPSHPSLRVDRPRRRPCAPRRRRRRQHPGSDITRSPGLRHLRRLARTLPFPPLHDISSHRRLCRVRACRHRCRAPRRPSLGLNLIRTAPTVATTLRAPHAAFVLPGRHPPRSAPITVPQIARSATHDEAGNEGRRRSRKTIPIPLAPAYPVSAPRR